MSAALHLPPSPSLRGKVQAQRTAVVISPPPLVRLPENQAGQHIGVLPLPARQQVLDPLVVPGIGHAVADHQQERILLQRKPDQAGIAPEPALRTLNSALNLRSDEQGSFTTIDLLAADLTAKQATLYKYGAAPTYIKRKGSVRRLAGASLPAGLQESDAEPQAIRFPLEENTFLLMISDGVADAGDDRGVGEFIFTTAL